MAAAAAQMANLAVIPSTLSYNPVRYPTISRIVCGPRDNRSPIVRGRTLSTEAILAVQGLKRAAMSGDLASSKLDEVVSTTLLRLIKSDLLAALTELQRQNRPALALKVFDAMCREMDCTVDCNSYAQMISNLVKNGMDAEIDDLVLGLLRAEEFEADLRGYARLMKVLISAGKGEAVKNIYRGFKGRGFVGDEYSLEIVAKGLRKLGESDAADEVEEDFEAWLDRGGGRSRVLPV